LVQYKLKVELNQDVLDKIAETPGTQIGEEKKDVEEKVLQTVKTAVIDMALKDSRNVKEETKER
jgi:hypothetical protein